ncbi:hypothetical protein Zmor_004594 [Zophobas morio]|uniref:Uncharacterized protein n=1 Tax=Zophobas morio TaxID=2755281 RepID=A0AA38IRV0_9CUCU|nr:hypothetical protein Zmor_004594 [Zophobas morio]
MERRSSREELSQVLAARLSAASPTRLALCTKRFGKPPWRRHRHDADFDRVRGGGASDSGTAARLGSAGGGGGGERDKSDGRTAGTERSSKKYECFDDFFWRLRPAGPRERQRRAATATAAF